MAFYFQNPLAQIYFHRSDSNILWLRGRIGFHHRFLQEKFCVGVGESRAVLHMKKYSVSIIIPNGFVQQRNKELKATYNRPRLQSCPLIAAMFHFQLEFTGTSKPRVFFRFEFPLFIHTVHQRDSFRIRAHIKSAFRATITTQPKNRCAINGFVYSSQEHGHSYGSAGVRKQS